MKLSAIARPLLSACLVLTGVSMHAGAVSHGDDSIVLDDAWVRAPAPGLIATAGFVILKNKSHADDRLVAVYSDIAKEVELHTMDTVDGVMRMRKMDNGLALPMGQSVVLKPGGFHIMFLGLQKKLMAGDEVQVVLAFEHAGNREHVFTVKPPTGMAHGDHKMPKKKDGHQSHSHD